MGVLSTTAKNAALNALTLSHAAAYDGDPNNGGTELDVQAITFGAASNGERSASTQPQFDIPSNSTVDWIQIRDGASGNEMAVDEVTPEAFNAAGTYTLLSFVVDIADPA